MSGSPGRTICFSRENALIDGGSTSGDVCFDTDLAGGGQFVVLYKPLFSSSQKREAWVNNL